MTNKQNPKFQELVAKLREIFQIDRPELDFGIYRILNAARARSTTTCKTGWPRRCRPRSTATTKPNVSKWRAS